MSIISSFEADNSAELAKRFASLATTYLDDPVAAKSDTAKVPLENLFRILEMYRYDAFADETRRGVLALEGFGQRFAPRSNTRWHVAIARALERALAENYQSVSKAEAIEQIQSSLRELASDGRVPIGQTEKVKKFFTTFGTTLA